jgi:hypothetical protein
MAVALASLLGMAAGSRAETWTVVPSLYVGAIYDDNLFYDDARVGVLGVQTGPVLSLEYQPSARLTLLGRAGWDSEYFAESAPSNWAAGRAATLTARYRPGEFTTASFSGGYARSAYAAELIPTAGVEYGRRTAESATGTLQVERRVSSRVVLRAGAGVQGLRLDGSEGEWNSQLSSAAELGLLVAPQTALTLRAGPRYLSGSWSPHVAGSLERVRPRTRLFIGYERGRGLVFDRTLDIESYSARVSYRLSPTLSVSASPALYRQWERAEEQRSWRIEGRTRYRARSWLTVLVDYAYVTQNGGLFIDRPAATRLSRNTLTAGFVIGPKAVGEQFNQ